MTTILATGKIFVSINYTRTFTPKPLAMQTKAHAMALIKLFLKSALLSLLACYGWLRIKCLRQPTLLIFTYHRILPTDDVARNSEQPGMITSPQALENHIRFAESIGATPIHLSDWVERNKQGRELPRLAIAFTFDDGWRDNFQYAYPRLKAKNTPATIFLVTEMVGTEKTFWPGQVLKLLTATSIPTEDERFDWLRPHLPKAANDSKPGPLTLAEADKVIGRLKVLDDASILDSLDRVDEIHSETSAKIHSRSILNSSELRAMSEEGLFRFGAHTKNHYRLNRLKGQQILEEEIVDCLADLQSLVDSSVSIFCYPNGDITGKGKELVSDHYQAACTTKSGWNPAGCDPYELKRFNLHDGNSSSSRALFATIGRGLL